MNYCRLSETSVNIESGTVVFAEIALCSTPGTNGRSTLLGAEYATAVAHHGTYLISTAGASRESDQ